MMREPLRPSAEILLVEDDPAEIYLLREAFLASPIRTHLTVVKNSVEAFAVLRQEGAYGQAPRPAIIVTSLMLPGRSGQEIVAELKGDLTLCMIPILVFTNCCSPWDTQRCYEAGANSYILKPPDLESLFAVVRMITVYWLEVITLVAPLGAPA